MARVLKYAMVGGGPGSFIGGAHRRAIRIEQKAELVCGAFSRDAAKSAQMAEELHLDPARCYPTYKAMLAAEAGNIDFVVIVTPNFSHYEIAKACLEAGVNVSCDKPVTISYAQAAELRELAKAKDLLFMVTYTYTGHVTAKYMRDIIKRGDIIMKVNGQDVKSTQELANWLASSRSGQSLEFLVLCFEHQRQSLVALEVTTCLY